jgi:ASC-1-like (ASCH) protein
MRTWILRLRATDTALFEDIRAGRKRVETRAATPRYQPVALGDTLVFVCGSRRCKKRITRVQRFKSIAALVKAIPFRLIMPSARSLAEVKEIYAGYSGYAEKIQTFGIVAWHIR